MVALTIVFGILFFLTADMLVQRRQLKYARGELARARSVPLELGTARANPISDLPADVPQLPSSSDEN